MTLLLPARTRLVTMPARKQGFFAIGDRTVAKSEPIEVEAIVTQALPNAQFKLKVEQGGVIHEILGHVSGKMRKHFIRILPGDKVKVEISPYDMSRGRI